MATVKKSDPLPVAVEYVNNTFNSQSGKDNVPKQLVSTAKKVNKESLLENQAEADKRKGLSNEKEKPNSLECYQSAPTTGKQSDGTADDKTAGSRDANGTAESTPGKMFDCSCGRTFETQRGLSLHLAHHPLHKPKPEKRDTPTKAPESGLSLSEPISPVHSPGSSPSSPYNISSFRTSARNPQYYSIIRTRSSSGAAGEGEGGTKRPRGSVGGAPPAKAMQLNSGEKLPLPGEVSEDSDKESPPQKRRSLKETDAKRAGKRPRTRSFSNSDPVSPKASPDDEAGGGAAVTVGSGQKNSPVTRSNSATMKAPEFVSLPSRRRRGGRRGGRGRGPSYNVRASEEADVDDESLGESLPPSPQAKNQPVKTTEPDPPVKRKRGRPPKIRKDPPETSGKRSSENNKGTAAPKSSKSLKASDSVDEDKVHLWENFGSENEGKESEEATPTDAYIVTSQKDSSGSFKTVSVSTLSKKGGNKEGEKETSRGGKTRKSAQKSVAIEVSSEEAPPTNKADTEAPPTKRTRSKPKTKEVDKNDKEVTGSTEGTKEEEEADKSDGAPPTAHSVIVSSASQSEEQSVDGESVETEKPSEQEGRQLSSQEPPLPPTSSPTGTYMHPYHYPGPYPHPPPIMYPPAPSSYHPYYGYPGGPPSGAYHVPPPGMMVPPPHPVSPIGDLSPHGGGGPFPPPHSTSANPQSTTVSGVQVSVIDKPPTQLPTVSVPLQMSSARPMYMEGASPGSPISPQAMMRPPYMGMGSPDEMSHPLSRTYRPGVMPPMPGYPPMHHPHQAPYHPHPHLAVRLDPTGMPYMEWAPTEHKPAPPEEPPSRPVECPECGRMFKNNKALNGHMRLHGGFDWTKKPYTAPEYAAKHAPLSMNKAGGASAKSGEENKQKDKKNKSNKRSRSSSRSPSPSSNSSKGSTNKSKRSSDEGKTKRGSKDSLTPLPVPRAPNVFTFDKVDKSEEQHSQSHNATLDDLCRAAELLDSMEGRGGASKRENPPENEEEGNDSEVDESGRRRPKNITIPPSQSTPAIERDRLRLGATPPYTPPPILSPSRSMTMLVSGVAPAPGTPCRILSHWSSRRSSDGHPLSESEESYNEPRINVGRDFQADLPPFSESTSDALQSDSKAVKVWQVIDDLTLEDEATVDGYLEIACSPAVLHSGRNKELALHLLYQLGGSVKEAVRCLLSGKSVFTPTHPMNGYNYSGAKKWTARERQQFRRAWRVHRKQFHLIRSAVESKKMAEVIEYYYTWKKYCSDEYRGRNRHFSEEILSDDEVGDLQSSSSEASGDHDTPPFSHSALKKGPTVKRERSSPSRIEGKQKLHEKDFEHLPIVYAPHTSQPAGQSMHQYKCKYPGCNQIFTSIFALNGHIRVHGGSFYPKPTNNGSASSSSYKPLILQNSTYSHSFVSPRGKSPSGKMVESRSQQQLELAKALLELPQPRSPARGLSYHTPSPKPSPKSRSPGGGVKKKLSSASPGEREGYYPCNRCGRVFTKVKSRSAHMKSHIVKQN